VRFVSVFEIAMAAKRRVAWSKVPARKTSYRAASRCGCLQLTNCSVRLTTLCCRWESMWTHNL